MFNITQENLHVYVFTLFGILIICFAVQFYIKSNLDTEMSVLKKKIKKLQQFQQLMIMHTKKREQYEKQQQIQQILHQDEEPERELDGDNDSYADPSGLR